MNNKKEINEQLRHIFNSIADNQQLDQHPWTKSLFVQDFIKNNPEKKTFSPGYHLLYAIFEIYLTITPQKISIDNKRLEAKWGQYGMLAALYFHPFFTHQKAPPTLGDAWTTMDQSIQFVASLHKTKINLKINPNQDDPPPSSTLSDWKNTGIDRLAEAIFIKEQLLEQSQSEERFINEEEKEDLSIADKQTNRRKILRSFLAIFLVLIISTATLIGWEAYQSYQLIMQIKTNADAAIGVLKTENPDFEEFDKFIQSIYQDARLLEDKLWNYAKIGEFLDWVPYIGRDLSELDQLTSIYSNSLQALHETYLGSSHIIALVQEGDTIFEPKHNENLINSAFQHFDKTHTSIEQIKSTRTTLSVNQFSDTGQEIITEIIDPHLTLLYLLDEGLFIAEASYAISKIAIPISIDFNIKEWDALLAKNTVQQVNPHMLAIREHEDQLLLFREQLNINQLYPSIQPLISTYLDPHLPLLDFGLAIYDYLSALSDPFIPLLDYQEQFEAAIAEMDFKKIAEILNALDITDDDIQHIQSQSEIIQQKYDQLNITTVHPSVANLITQYIDPNMQVIPFITDLVKLVPALDTLGSEFAVLMDQDPLSITVITTWLEKNQSDAGLILETLKITIQSRNQLDITQLSPYISTPIINRLDPALTGLYDGLLLLKNIPALLGLGEHEPQTYLILIQNEDELRATGGFITAAGTIVIDDGKPLSIQIKNSGELDNLNENYPYVPWQMEEYMHLGLWLIRDANWHPDFRIVADFAEEEYALYSGASVDGVIALNQEALRILLTGMQPINYKEDMITADNIIEKLRHYRTIDTYQNPSTSKAFIEELTTAMVKQILNSTENNWYELFEVTKTALDERLILFVLDQPDIQNIIHKNSWDGHIERETSDYLLMVDSNLGYNKVNPMISTSFEYIVNLADLQSPTAKLRLLYKNNVELEILCTLYIRNSAWRYYDSLLERCYWNYLRVFPAAGAELIDANPQEIPEISTLSYKTIPAQIDSLSSIDGGEGFGTFMVVPTNAEHNLALEYSLPIEVIKFQEDNSYRYELHIQKQSGTISLDGVIQIKLPISATLIDASSGYEIQGNTIFWTVDSRIDLYIFVEFDYSE